MRRLADIRAIEPEPAVMMRIAGTVTFLIPMDRP